MPRGKTLRLIVAARATVVWTDNDWGDVHTTEVNRNDTLELWFADLTAREWPQGARIEFTFFWKDAQRWEGRNFGVVITA